MGDGTKENPYTRKDVEKKIEEHGGKAKGLDLSGKVFEAEIDLRELDLNGIILKGATFRNNLDFNSMKFVGAHLEGASLLAAHLEKAYLSSAHLEGTDLEFAHLEGAVLLAVHLEKANLSSAHLERVDLALAHLEGADLSNAHLKGAFLIKVEISSTTRLANVNWGNHILKEENPRAFEFAADTYRKLKQWYTTAGMYDIAGQFYYREKEAIRKSLKLSPKQWNNRLAAELMRYLFGYGERWWNILFWIAGVVFGFGSCLFPLRWCGSTHVDPGRLPE